MNVRSMLSSVPLALASCLSITACQAEQPARALATPEVVVVQTDAESAEVRRVIRELREGYGVVLASDACSQILHEAYPRATAAGKAGMQATAWRLEELLALERALAHFAPLLRREGGMKGITGSSTLQVGKVERSVRHFVGESLIGMHGDPLLVLFDRGLSVTKPDFADLDDWLEGIWVHELGHALAQQYIMEEWVRRLEFWIGPDHPSARAGVEAPITEYGATAANEDFCEALMFYFIEPHTLLHGTGRPAGMTGNACPRRFELLSEFVASWSR